MSQREKVLLIILNGAGDKSILFADLDDEDKGVVKHDTPGGAQDLTVIGP